MNAFVFACRFPGLFEKEIEKRKVRGGEERKKTTLRIKVIRESEDFLTHFDAADAARR